MDVRLLGPLEVRLEDGPTELGPRKQRAVLAMLALEAGRTVSADRLAEGLWGEAPPATAPKMVQLYVSRLRRVLNGNEAEIVTRGRGYELRLPDDKVDSIRFERLVDTHPRDALALWRGEPLADLADEPFAAAEIRRLEQLRLRAIGLAVDADLAAGRHAEVIGELDALVAQQPLHERLHAQRMLALYRSGRQGDALEAYREARTALVEQIGVEPGAELRRLHEAILAQDPALDAPAGTEPAPLPQREPAPDPEREAPSPRARLPLFAAALVLAGVLAFGVIRLLQPDGLDGIDEDTVGVIDPDGGQITAQYSVGHGPQALAAGAGSMWVANQLDGTVSRIDRGRSERVTIDVGGKPTGLAFGAGSLWVADGQGRQLAQIAPQTNKVVDRIDVGNAAHAVAAGYGAVWVASALDATVVRIDVRTGNAGPPLPVQARPSALATGAGGVWVASDATGRVVRLDPRTGTPLTSITVGNGPSAVAVGAGAVWVANRNDGTVSRIDPESEVTETVRVGREPRAVTAGRDGVWVANAGDGTVVRIDPGSRRVTSRVAVESSPAALALAGGGVWAAALGAASTHRGGTLRVTGTDTPGPESFDPTSLNPHLGLVYDGLVTYRRAGGSAGGTIVPDLARELPEPSPDGRTYRLRLRPDIRFSTGAPVRPADVRASFERWAKWSAPEADGLADYMPIRGVARCGVRRCDLSEGVAIDERVGTVTLHLTKPDPDFLHKLTNILVIPTGSPQKVTTRALPGTGPYMVKRFNTPGSGLFVRNPHFRVWSPDRPDGFPDQIETRSTDEPDAMAAAVDRGAADIAILDFGVGLTTSLMTRSGARLHMDPFPQVGHVFLNVHAPPFDDARVRRALNYAVDRARVARLTGGPDILEPTCQLLPPGFPGYTPACPFTVNPNRAGVWIGPDLAKARRLVAASGTQGMRVEFWGSEPWPGIGQYFRTLLRKLGYRSELRTFEDLHLIIENASLTTPQLGLWGWIADSTAPFTFLQPLVSCGAETNLSRFCNPELDARMRQAAAASGPEAVEQWRRVEATLAADAPTVPLSNLQDAVLTAERVGNYQHHPLWGPLLDQLWIK